MLADIMTMIEAMSDYHDLSALQTLAVETNKQFKILQLAAHSLGDSKFRLDYVVNQDSTPDRFMVEVYTTGVGGDFYNTYSSVDSVVIAEYNNSQYDV